MLRQLHRAIDKILALARIQTFDGEVYDVLQRLSQYAEVFNNNSGISDGCAVGR